MDFPYWNYSYVVIIVLQLVCILHMFRTGRNREWFYLLIFLPFIGALVYIVQEIIPGYRSANNSGAPLRLFSGGRIKELERKLRLADTDTNRQNLAAELAACGQYDRAIELTQACMKGIYADNLGMMQHLARYSYAAGKYEQSRAWFEKIALKKDARIEMPEDEMMYAKTLLFTGEKVKAEEAFKRIIRMHHSLEARYNCGLLLKEAGKSGEAQAQFQAVLDERDLHPKHVQIKNRQWVAASRKELATLK